MWDLVSPYLDEALLLLAGSGGTAIWGEYASRKDTPIKLDVAIEEIQFGYDKIDVRDFDQILNTSEILHLTRRIASSG